MRAEESMHKSSLIFHRRGYLLFLYHPRSGVRGKELAIEMAQY